jgi:hypothetical protein
MCGCTLHIEHKITKHVHKLTTNNELNVKLLFCHVMFLMKHEKSKPLKAINNL